MILRDFKAWDQEKSKDIHGHACGFFLFRVFTYVFLFFNGWKVEVYVHDVLGSPGDGVSVEVTGGVEPEVELLLPVALPLSEYIGVEDIRISTYVSQELEVDLVMRWPLRRQLHALQNIIALISNFILKK